MSTAETSVPLSPPLSQRLRRVLAVMLVFFLVGPPVGAMVFMLATAVVGLGVKTDLSSLLLVGAFSMIYAVPLSYLVGAGPALMTGAGIGLWLAFLGRMTWPFAVLAGLIAGMVLLSMSIAGFPPQNELFNAPAVPVMQLHVPPTLICCHRASGILPLQRGMSNPTRIVTPERRAAISATPAASAESTVRRAAGAR